MAISARKRDGKIIGYQARYRGVNKYFSFSKHGINALSKATQYQLRLKTEARKNDVLPKSNTGVKGLYIVKRVINGSMKLYIQCSYKYDGEWKSKRFALSINWPIDIVAKINDLFAALGLHGYPLNTADKLKRALRQFK